MQERRIVSVSVGAETEVVRHADKVKAGGVECAGSTMANVGAGRGDNGVRTGIRGNQVRELVGFRLGKLAGPTVDLRGVEYDKAARYQHGTRVRGVLGLAVLDCGPLDTKGPAFAIADLLA